MKLAMQYMSGIEGIGVTQSISFVFFLGMFLFILYYVVTTKNSYYTGISEMPLEDEVDQYSDKEIK